MNASTFRRGTLFCAMTIALAASASAQTVCPGQTGAALLTCVRANYTPTNVRSYDAARDFLFSQIENDGGTVEGVYTGATITVDPGGANPRGEAFGKGFDTEHSFPQSQGTGSVPPRADLHHLFPTLQAVNSARGSLPFGEIDDADTDTWYRGTTSTSSIPPLATRDEYSERDNGVAFEPREEREGDLARAVFYIAAIYEGTVSSTFFDEQKADLLTWHAGDPAGAAETARSGRVKAVQGNDNPFVLDPTLADRAFGSSGGGGGSESGTVIVSEIAEPAQFQGEFVELYNAGASAVNLDGWTLAQSNSTQTTTLDASSLQNGSLTLASGAYAVVGRGSAAEFASVFGSLPATYFSQGNSSNDGAPQINGDEIYILSDGASAQIDTFAPPGGFDDANDRYQRIAYPGEPGTSAAAWFADSTPSTPGAPNDQTLPVELTTFAARLDGAAVVLTWATSSETNNSGFSVEMRNAEIGTRNGRDAETFEQIGFVEGAGTTVQAHTYTFASGELAPGRYRFRLKQTDYDGAQSYSPEIEVSVEMRGAYRLSAPYPNPARGAATFSLGVKSAQNVTVAAYDALGRRVATLFAGRMEAGAARVLTLDGAALPAGLYVIRASGETFGATRTVTVLR